MIINLKMAFYNFMSVKNYLIMYKKNELYTL